MAMLLVAASPAFMSASHLARHDIMAASLGFGAIALHVSNRGAHSPVVSGLSGLAIGLAFEIHPNGAIFGVTLVALHCLDHGRLILLAKGFWGFAAGICVGLAFYVAMHILPYPQTYLSLTSIFFGPTRVPPILVPDPVHWVRSIADAAELLSRSLTFAIPVAVMALVAVWLRASKSDKTLLVLAASHFLAFSLLVRAKNDYYLILVSPMLDLVLAVFLVSWACRLWHVSLWSRLRTALSLGLVLASAMLSLTSALDNPMDDYRAVTKQLAAIVPPDSSVMGSQTYWFELPNHRYLSWEQLVFYQRQFPGSTLTDALFALQPDYLVIDRQMRAYIGDGPAEVYNYESFQLLVSRTELQRFLDSHSRAVADVDTWTYGELRIYRLEYDSSQRPLPMQSRPGV